MKIRVERGYSDVVKLNDTYHSKEVFERLIEDILLIYIQGILKEAVIFDHDVFIKIDISEDKEESK